MNRAKFDKTCLVVHSRLRHSFTFRNEKPTNVHRAAGSAELSQVHTTISLQSIVFTPAQIDQGVCDKRVAIVIGCYWIFYRGRLKRVPNRSLSGKDRESQDACFIEKAVGSIAAEGRNLLLSQQHQEGLVHVEVKHEPGPENVFRAEMRIRQLTQNLHTLKF